MESPTFVSIIDEIIKDFYIKYMTVGSLQKITEILDPSKYPEYEEYICVINKTIKEYGKANRRLTNIQVKQFTNLLRKYKNAIAIKNTFSYVVKDILNNFDRTYQSKESLSNVFDVLLEEEKIKYSDKIQSFYDTLNESDELNNDQRRRLKIQLATYKNPPYCYKGFENIPIRKDEKAPKLDSEDIISSVIFLLITEISCGLGSGLTIPVYDYFDVIDDIIQIDYNKYNPITSEIKECLVKHGWRCKNKETNGGFYTEPNKSNLVDDLSTIINEYF